MESTTTTVQARMPLDLKQQGEALFRAMGMTPSDAIRIFFQQTVNSGGLPFQLKPRALAVEMRRRSDMVDKGNVPMQDAEEYFATKLQELDELPE